MPFACGMTRRYCGSPGRSLHYGAFSTREARGVNMQNPLDSLWGTVIAGVILTVVLYYVAKLLIGG